MQKKSRREQTGQHVAEQDDRIEAVQLAGVVERRKDERNQTEHVKMPRLLRRSAAEVDEQPDDQISHADQILIDHRQVAGDLCDDYGCLEFDAGCCLLRFRPNRVR